MSQGCRITGALRCHTPAVACLLAGFALLAASSAIAQPHQPPPEWKDLSGPPVEPDVWLRRLVGTYRFDGMIANHDVGVKGKADCVAIGTGPGVQCVLNVTWQDIWMMDLQSARMVTVPGGVSYLDPAMVLFGLDPGKQGINYLLVDNKGLPEGGVGRNSSDRAVFKTPCVDAPGLFDSMATRNFGEPYRTCDRIIRIEAKPDARIVYMWIDFEINEIASTSFLLSLRREQESSFVPDSPSDRPR